MRNLPLGPNCEVIVKEQGVYYFGRTPLENIFETMGNASICLGSQGSRFVDKKNIFFLKPQSKEVKSSKRVIWGLHKEICIVSKKDLATTGQVEDSFKKISNIAFFESTAKILQDEQAFGKLSDEEYELIRVSCPDLKRLDEVTLVYCLESFASQALLVFEDCSCENPEYLIQPTQLVIDLFVNECNSRNYTINKQSIPSLEELSTLMHSVECQALENNKLFSQITAFSEMSIRLLSDKELIVQGHALECSKKLLRTALYASSLYTYAREFIDEVQPLVLNQMICRGMDLDTLNNWLADIDNFHV